MSGIEVKVAGESLQLLAQKAVYWPRKKMLILADAHFGKATSFRARGIPVPHGTTTQNLALLDALIASHDITHIIFLGDFLHAKIPHTSITLTTLVCWRERNAQLQLLLVRGNHDRQAGDPPSGLNIQIVNEPYCIAPFAFCHHPDLTVPGYVLAGHIHPVFWLISGKETLRLPCFLMNTSRMILPSFGAFTGGFSVISEPEETVFVTTGDAIFEVIGEQ